MTSREFDIQFRKLYLPLGMYAMRIVDDGEWAEDLVEDVFAKAWQIVSTGGEIENFRSYMYRSVRNACITFLRDRKIMEDIGIIPEITEETVDTSLRDAKIWKAIDELPERCREVFLMSKRDGLTNEEIAEELGISVKTVKNQMTKAFSRMREALSSGHKPFFLPFL
ncbi:MAG: RNA polymerase sigma-70 factor [Muribaculaceae bacterium]|nr:RNA polymerase sigma-70 factor [Muribaculaceae bacterium]